MELNTLLYERVYDMFNYYNIITKINQNYLLVFDKKKKLYLVLNSAKNFQICLKTPTILTNFEKILNETKIENSKKLFDFIEKSNQNIEQKNISNKTDELAQKTKELLHTLKRVNSIKPSTVTKIIEGKHA